MNDFMFKLCIEILLCTSQAYTTHTHTDTSKHITLSLYRNPPENCAKTKRNDESKRERDLLAQISKRKKFSLCVSFCELKENEQKN